MTPVKQVIIQRSIRTRFHLESKHSVCVLTMASALGEFVYVHYVTKSTHGNKSPNTVGLLPEL